MDAITNWSFSVSGYGWVGEYDNEFYYAGGFVIAGFGSSATNFSIFNLGNSQVAVMVKLTDQDNNPHQYYWNSHYSFNGGSNNGGMALWSYLDNYESNSIGPEQTFRLVNLGGGNVAFQATSGAFSGRYLSAQNGGWYPWQFGLGSGSFISSGSPTAFQISGDQLPILVITNSGYQLNLSGRSLGNLNLTNADMRGCNLQNADLSKISAWGNGNFTGADLVGANLEGQQLAGANWTQANFTGTDLRSLAGAAGATLPGAIFNGANLGKVSLAKASLKGAQFRNAVLDGADFSNADLSGANLTGASLVGTNFQGANLQGTCFDSCNLSSALFDASPNFTRNTNGRTTFKSATVPFAVLNKNWSYLDLTEATITGIPSSIPALVADAALLPSGLDLQGIDLAGASFQGTQMFQIQLQKANLQSANLRNALLKGAKLNAANLTLANLDSAWLIAEQTAGMAWRDAVTQVEAAVATEALLFNTILDGAHCDGVDFSGAIFVTSSFVSSTQKASAVGASMTLAKFSDAALVLAVFDGAQLSGADFSGATLVGASFQDNGAQATALTPTGGVTHTPASVYQADLRGTNFAGANMDGLDMRSATMSDSGGIFEKVYTAYDGSAVPVSFQYGATVLGNTTKGTTCPNNSPGPCTVSGSTSAPAAAAAPLAPKRA